MFTCIRTKILQLEQRQLYGSSRLGVITQEVRIAENASWPNVTPTYDTANAPFVLWNSDSTYLDSVFINPFDSVGYKIKVNKYLGFRNYELSNHLGNVLAVISDRKYGEDANTDGQLELFKPNVLSETDYYAFGSQLNERSVSEGYRFGFNGKELDKETGTLDFGNRIYNPDLARWLSEDPLQVKYPNLSPYSFVANKPIIAIDPDGKDILIVGDAKTQTIIFSQLQSLTNKQLVLLNNGIVLEASNLTPSQQMIVYQTGVNKSNSGIMVNDKPEGSQLVHDAINNKNLIKIHTVDNKYAEDKTHYTNPENVSNKDIGTGSDIFHDPEDDGTKSPPSIKNENGTVGRDAKINLAHELKHALNGATGTHNGRDDSGYGDPDNLTKDGKTYELSKEELSTRKFEQKISKEQNEPVRASPIKMKK